MSDNITKLYAQQYTSNIQLLLQQKGSKLRGTFMEDTHYGEQAVAVDQVAASEAEERTTRYPEIAPANTDDDRRWVFPQAFDHTEWLDTLDKIKLLGDPTSAYVTNGLYALGRKLDDVIINAYFADAKTGKTGATTTSFPSTQQVDAATGSTADTGMNVAKLQAGIETLLTNEVDLDQEQVYCVISAKQNTDLLNEIKVISSDFSRVLLDSQNRIQNYMGIRFLHSQRLKTNSSSYRRCPLYVRSGGHLGIWADVSTDITQRKDRRGLPWQVYIQGTWGATRLEEKKIVELPCKES